MDSFYPQSTGIPQLMPALVLPSDLSTSSRFVLFGCTGQDLRVLHRSGRSGHVCLVTDFKANAYNTRYICCGLFDVTLY